MEFQKDSNLLRIFMGEMDKIGHQPLYEAIVFAATSHVYTAKLIDISEDLPVIAAIVDYQEKIKSLCSGGQSAYGISRM